MFTSICFTSIHTNAQTQDIIFKGDGYEKNCYNLDVTYACTKYNGMFNEY